MKNSHDKRKRNDSDSDSYSSNINGDDPIVVDRGHGRHESGYASIAPC